MTRSLRFAAVALGCALCLAPLACVREPDARPSVLLVVIDTLRADAVSSYGQVSGTTPVLDALAEDGLRYGRAFAPASWTLPSHASLLAGVEVRRHRVGMPGRVALADEVVTLAERFREAGYDTAAFAENLLVSDVFGLLQGFDHTAVTRVIPKSQELALSVYVEIDAPGELRTWLAGRDGDRPFFVFVNLVDAHSPYSVRDDNPWVPAGASRADMERHAEQPELLLCRSVPPERDLDILRGLYLGDVAEADRKLGELLEAARDRLGAAPLLTAVTSDHGELFGDRGLLGHEFNVRRGALQVPLVVHGLPDTQPAVVEAPVTLVDLAASLLLWTGVGDPAELDGRPLPTTPAASDGGAPRRLIASYSDAFTRPPEAWRGMLHVGDKERARRRCGPDDKVFGGMASVIEYPFKLDWYERYPAELYDLRWDPGEQSELSAHHPDEAAALRAAAERFADEAGLRADATADATKEGAAPELDPAQRQSLRALGYID